MNVDPRLAPPGEDALDRILKSTYVHRYSYRAKGALAEFFGLVNVVQIAELPGMYEKLADRAFTYAQWRELVEVDVVASVVRPDGSLLVILVEASPVVETCDVERAHRRAEILRVAGLGVTACVDGDTILETAAALAKELGVYDLVTPAA